MSCASNHSIIRIMRTTITIDEQLAAGAKRMTGKTRLSEALSELVARQLRVEKQLAALDFLAKNKPDVTWKQIKAARKGRRWSA